MRRLFSRAASPAASEPVPTLPGVSLNCAHGCPACPHPATWTGFDDKASSNLLPQSNAALDGQPLHFEEVGRSSPLGPTPDFGADAPDDDLEAPD